MEPVRIPDIVENQKRFFQSGTTKDLGYREEQLRKLHNLIRREQGFIIDALKKDMAKPTLEAYASEVAVTLNEIRHARRNLTSWTKVRRVMTNLPLLPSSSFIVPEPLGVVLIIAPWNYPFQLTMVPLVAAMAAGNCALIKPSELAPYTGMAIEELVTRYLDPGYVSVVNGGPEVSKELLVERFDHIFFTGSARIARIVMQAASRYLTPVTLELGGKSPCIVDKDIKIEYASRRIAWAKFFNAGQTCVAPDYLLVDQGIRDKFVEALTKTVIKFYGTNPRESPYYARIINRPHFDRLYSYMDQGNIIIGGQALAQDLYIAPTLIDNVSAVSPVMQEEIFGPILPILTYREFPEAIDFIKARPKPLALYLFSSDRKKQELVRKNTSSGGYCINDAMVHLVSPHLPFGGVGDSGTGLYHGKAGFDTFSHMKSMVRNTLRYDIPLRYVPYRFKLGLVKWLF